MGHLFRALNLVAELKHRKITSIIYINNDEVSKDILQQNHVPYRQVDLNDTKTNWERFLIQTDDIKLWVNDRLDTNLCHAEFVKRSKIPLVTFDDRGLGASLADVHVAGLVFEDKLNLKGKKIFRGVDYLVLNPKIRENKRIRKKLNNVLVTLGGTDTHGVTINVVNILKSQNIPATIIVGPGFCHWEGLKKALDKSFTYKHHVPSLIDEFYHYDLAITGGGITPFEANATGLPCVVIANEPFEISVGEKLQDIGSSLYAGPHENFEIPDIRSGIRLKNMSFAGIKFIGINGTENVVDILADLC